MQSAFVDLGLERDAFLYVTDVISPTEEALEDEDEPRPRAGAAMPSIRRSDRRPSCEHRRRSGAGGASSPRAADDGGRPAECAAGPGRRRPRPPTRPRPTAAAIARPRDRDRQPPTATIEDLLKEGQEVVVQVVKEPLGTKGARITSHLSLPGRFLVYMPTVDHIGVSRKIDSRDERRRLRTHRAAVPRAVGPARRRHHPHRRVEPLRRRHRRRPAPTSSRSGPRSSASARPSARRPCCSAKRAWSPSCCATC